MKLGICEVSNFGSYDGFQIDLSDIGLALIYGATGSGKSTIADMPCWIMFGVTSKNGAADDVKSWNDTGSPTRGELDVTLADGTQITISRTRGKSHDSDLYWTEGEEIRRGKDITETQKLLSQRLGCNADLYITGAYFHEFNPTTSFFIAPAKDRRAVFEKIANMDLAVKLTAGIKKASKESKGRLEAASAAYERSMGAQRAAKEEHTRLSVSAEQWKRNQEQKLARLEISSNSFEANIQEDIEERVKQEKAFDRQIEEDKTLAQTYILTYRKSLVCGLESELSSIRQEGLNCTLCGGIDPQQQKKIEAVKDEMLVQERIKDKIERLERDIKRLNSSVNPYRGQADQLRKAENVYKKQLLLEKRTENPFTPSELSAARRVNDTRAAAKSLGADLAERLAELGYLKRLNALCEVLRGALVNKAVKTIEAVTNAYMVKYFSSEILVNFSVGGDDIQVELYKNGHYCSYRQLSKGQRGLLKLCFTVAVMKAASNNSGQHFSTLFFDESLDGLDSDLKIAAFGMFQELAKDHTSVLVVEHSPEFQQMFDTKCKVTLAGDHSEVEEQHG